MFFKRIFSILIIILGLISLFFLGFSISVLLKEAFFKSSDLPSTLINIDQENPNFREPLAEENPNFTEPLAEESSSDYVYNMVLATCLGIILSSIYLFMSEPPVMVMEQNLSFSYNQQVLLNIINDPDDSKILINLDLMYQYFINDQNSPLWWAVLQENPIMALILKGWCSHIEKYHHFQLTYDHNLKLLKLVEVFEDFINKH